MSVTEIVENPYFTLALAVVAILGLALTVVFYRRSRWQKQPLFEIARRNLIQNKNPLIPGLSVHFKGEEQEMITVAHVWFWNHGKETINASDIAEAKPLVIRVSAGVELLDVQMVKSVDVANRCTIGEPERQEDESFLIPVRFDYLDKGDGLVVQIVHNGDAHHRIRVEGKIKGVKKIAKAADAHAFYIERPTKVPDITKIMDRPKVVGIVSFLVLAGAGIALLSQTIGPEGKWYLWIPAIFCFLLALACYPIYLRHLIPKDLNIELETAQPEDSGDSE